MAVDFEVKPPRTSEYGFDPVDIIIKPELNGRHDLPDIAWLIADILKVGQLQPVIVRNESGKAVLCAGFSRWRAISEINKKKLAPGGTQLKVRACYFRGSELDGFQASIRENRFRNATTPLDDAYNCDRLQKWGQTVEQIAEAYQEKVAWVKGRLKLIDLEPEAKAAVKAGRLKTTAAAHIAKLSAEQQREAVKGQGKVKGKSAGNSHISIGALRAIIMARFEDSNPDSDLREFCAKLLDLIDERLA